MSAISSITTGSNTGGVASGKDNASIADTFDAFLTLLTTQLKHQDPLAPMDSNQFVQQLVEFSQVEQSIKTNSQLSDLLKTESTSQSLAALNYVGRTVEATGNASPLAANGKAEYSYTMPAGASDATVGILDSSGRVIYSAPADKTPGKHGFVWDGTDSSGNVVPTDGVYRIGVMARKADGTTLEVPTGVVARVSGITTDPSGYSLMLGPVSVAISDVVAVRDNGPGA
jgi:flagellar basal-body rod modification protein FlgD